MKTFDELFELALRYETVEVPKNEAHKAAIKAYYNCTFNDWLTTKFNWETGDEEHYQTFLNPKSWNEFLDDLRESMQDAVMRMDEEVVKWKNSSQSIPSLTYNSVTIPYTIFEYFRSLGDQRSFSISKSDGVKRYGKPIPPFYMNYIAEENGIKYNFFTLEKYYNMFRSKLESGELYGEDNICLHVKTVSPYLVSYAKGFHAGYNGFASKISSNAGLFDKSNLDLAYKIFERVYPELLVRTGNIAVIQYSVKEKKEGISKKLFYETGFEGGEYYKAWELILANPMLFKEFFDKIFQVQSPEEIEVNDKTEMIVELKPSFVVEIIEPTIAILKDYFSAQDQSKLKKLFLTGENVDDKLFFKAEGNKLTDTFRELIEANLIVSCTKTQLSNWVIANFRYQSNGAVKHYVYSTVERTISGKGQPCKNPLIKVKQGKVIRASDL